MNRLHIALGAMLTLASPLTMAAVSDADFQALKDSIAVLTQKLTDMEKEMAVEKAKAAQAAPAQPAAVAAAPAAPAKPAAASWTEKLTIQGDLRGRYENIDTENADDRNRDRIRVRAGIVAKPQSDIEIGVGLSTGQDGDPVSSNQTIGNGGSRKDIYLDLAYVNWSAVEGLNVIGGKFKNNQYRPGKHSLVWDSDLNPEGLALTYLNGAFFANAIGTWVESDSASSRSEAYGIGGQAGVIWPLNDVLKLTAGAGYFTVNSEGKGPFYGTSLFGNSGVGGRYVYDYNDIEGFAELGFQLFGQPAMVFVDYVKNTDADEFDTGWASGVQFGAAKAKGTWEVSYAYQDLEADAVFGLWTDSDFGGGGTDNSGHVLRGAYALSDKTNMAFAYFINEIDENLGTESDYDRLQLDLNFKY